MLRGSCEASGGESLRFLLEDVVKVTALFPWGNKASERVRIEGMQEGSKTEGESFSKYAEDIDHTRLVH